MQNKISFKNKEPKQEFDPNNYKNYNFDDDENENKPFKLGYEDEKYNEINYGKNLMYPDVNK